MNMCPAVYCDKETFIPESPGVVIGKGSLVGDGDVLGDIDYGALMRNDLGHLERQERGVRELVLEVE